VKTNAFFPGKRPLLFFARNAVSSLSGSLSGQWDIRFFAAKRTLLNCTVKFPYNLFISKNTRLKRKSWSGLAPFPLELPGSDPAL